MANVVEILIKGKDEFTQPAKEARSSAGGLGSAMKGLGSTVAGVATGFIAAQASIAGVQKVFTSSIGAAVAFEHQLATIRGLTGATKQDTDFLAVAIKDMAATMPKSPEELGAGAYFILSSGITDTSTAMAVLESAAKASVAGLGETQTIASAVTSVMNAYGLSAEDAAFATDTLVNTVKLGKSEPVELAQSLGMVIPIAAQMGVSFQEVGAVMATLTNTGLDAAASATALRGVMAQLLSPSKEAEEVLGSLGTSASELRQQIKERGLIDAMNKLMVATGGNQEVIAKLFPDIRGLIGVFSAFGNQANQTRANLEAMNAGAGATDAAFKEVSETTKYKVDMAMHDLNLTLMELGETILPAVVPAVQFVTLALKDLVAIVDSALHPIEALSTALEDLPGRVKEPWMGLLDQQELTAANFVKMALDAKRSEEQIRQIGEDMGLTASQINQAFREAGVGIDETGTSVQFDIMQMKQRAEDFRDAMETDVGPKSVASLEDIEGAADNARRALTDMFRETTQQEADAELALANLKLEAGRLEAQVGDLTAEEAERLRQLQEELIPTQETHLDLLKLERDAVEAKAAAETNAGPTMDDWARRVDKQTEAVKRLDSSLRGLPERVIVELGISMQIVNAVGGVTPSSGGGGGGGGGGGVDPNKIALQHGTPYVPRDNFYFLHRGEAVIPAAENARGAGGITVNSLNVALPSVTDAPGFMRELERLLGRRQEFAARGVF